jgi:hypothetical protein
MTSTIIPYPKFLTKPWRCMALQAVHRQAVHCLAIHHHRHCGYINVMLPSKHPLPSRRHQAVHCQAIVLSIAEPSVSKPFITVTIKPSIAVTLLHCCHVTIKPSITLVSPSSRPSSCQLPSGHSIVIALPSCHPSPSPCTVHRQAVHRQAIHCQAIHCHRHCASQPSHSLPLLSHFH